MTPKNVDALFWWEIQQADTTKMTIQHCFKLILLVFIIWMAAILNPPPFLAATDPIQIASNL